MNYRSIMGCFSCVGGIRLTTVVLRALTHWAIHTNYLCLGWSLNSIFNLHNSIFNPASNCCWCQKSRNGQKQCGLPLRDSTVSKVRKKRANWTSHHRGVHWETGRGEGVRAPLSAAMGGQYVNERLAWRWIMNEQHSEHSWREHVSPSLSFHLSSSCPKISIILSSPSLFHPSLLD